MEHADSVLRRNEAVRHREHLRREAKLQRPRESIEQRNRFVEPRPASPSRGRALAARAPVKQHKLHRLVSLTLQGRRDSLHRGPGAARFVPVESSQAYLGVLAA